MEINWSATDIPLWLTLAITAFFTVLGVVIAPVATYLIRRPRETADISGVWASYWETKAHDDAEEEWIFERIDIRRKWLGYRIVAT